MQNAFHGHDLMDVTVVGMNVMLVLPSGKWILSLESFYGGLLNVFMCIRGYIPHFHNWRFFTAMLMIQVF
jgi:hypothetical protein